MAHIWVRLHLWVQLILRVYIHYTVAFIADVWLTSGYACTLQDDAVRNLFSSQTKREYTVNALVIFVTAVSACRTPCNNPKNGGLCLLQIAKKFC